MRDPKYLAPEFTRHGTRYGPTDHCGRMDRHAAHEWILQAHAGYAPTILACPGVVTVEGGALETHDCGARVHPSEIRECCGRCTGTLCPECAPCRRVS